MLIIDCDKLFKYQRSRILSFESTFSYKDFSFVSWEENSLDYNHYLFYSCNYDLYYKVMVNYSHDPAQQLFNEVHNHWTFLVSYESDGAPYAPVSIHADDYDDDYDDDDYDDDDYDDDESGISIEISINL